MTTFGITGHQHLSAPTDWDWVGQEIKILLSGGQPPIVGISSLAIGADQLFAKAVLDAGGTLEAVIPFDGYSETFKESDRVIFENLRNTSSRVEVLTTKGSKEQSYLAAGMRVVDLSECIVAVWNGTPSGGLGGTADIVQYAIANSKHVVHINPARRTVT
jgi:hypothetical protein